MSSLGAWLEPAEPEAPSPLAERLAQAVARWDGQAEAVCFTFPAPRAPLEALFGVERFAREIAVLLDPGGDGGGAEAPGQSGLGAALLLEATGPGRFEALERRAAELAGRIAAVGLEGARPRLPSFVGGLAFEAELPPHTPFEALGPGCFVLPRWTYRRDGSQPTLSFTVAGEARAVREEAPLAQREAEALLAALARPPAPPELRPLVALARSRPERFAEGVAMAKAAFAAGAAEKVVLARRTLLEWAEPVAHEVVLARLAAEAEGAVRFAFRRRGALFFGATPERLVRRAGEEVSTVALAGSIRPGAGDGELLESAKDRAEHAYVVEDVAARLRRFCTTVSHEATPELRRLRHVAHLATPIAGTLARPAHVLEVAAELHPTPATAGVPRAEALEVIRAAEDGPRGWYAGPFGWFDPEGDGELWVALRSGLLLGRRALVFAGAGLVPASDPDLEYAETVLKERVVLGALGARP